MSITVNGPVDHRTAMSVDTDAHGTRTEREETDTGDTRRRRRRRNPAAMQRYLYLGTDGEGFTHVANQHRKIVYRCTPAGRLDRVTDLEAHPDPGCRTISAYLAYVADGVGWDARRVATSPLAGWSTADSPADR